MSVPRERISRVSVSQLNSVEEALMSSLASKDTHMVQERFAAIWRELLAIGEVTPTDHFLRSGGTSLDAIRLQLRIRRSFGIQLPIHEILRAPGFGELANLIETGLSADHVVEEESVAEGELERSCNGGNAPHQSGHHRHGRPQVEELPRQSGESRWLPIGPTQKSQLTHQLSEPASTAYVESFGFELAGELDLERLERSFQALVERHEILRTTYARTETGDLVQAVHRELPPEWVEVALGQADAYARQVELNEEFRRQAERGIDLEHGPLIRVVVARLEASRHRLLWLVHHIAVDEWSFRVLVDELGALYRAGGDLESAGLPPLESGFHEWSASRAPRAYNKDDLAWWREHLEGHDDGPPLPQASGASDRRQGPVGITRFQLDPGQLEALRRLANEKGISLFTTLFTAYAAFWARMNGQDRFVLGTPMSLRDDPAIERSVGFFLNIVPLRIDAGGVLSFRDLLERVHHELLEIHAHRESPFDRIVQQLHRRWLPQRSPLVQNVFVMLDRPLPVPELPGIEATSLPFKHNEPKWELVFSAV